MLIPELVVATVSDLMHLTLWQCRSLSLSYSAFKTRLHQTSQRNLPHICSNSCFSSPLEPSPTSHMKERMKRCVCLGVNTYKTPPGSAATWASAHRLLIYHIRYQWKKTNILSIGELPSPTEKIFPYPNIFVDKYILMAYLNDWPNERLESRERNSSLLEHIGAWREGAVPRQF